MSKKEEETNRNFKRGLVIFILGVILLVLFIWSTGAFSKNSDATKFYSEYGSVSDIKENNLYKYASKEQVLNILDHDTCVIYFVYSTCTWCKSMVSVLNDAAREAEVKEINYYDIKNDRDELVLNENNEIITEKQGTAFYRELLKELDDVLSPYLLKDSEGKEVDTEEKRIYVPLVVFVKEGEAVFAHQNTIESQDDPMKKLTKKEEEELKAIYKKGFDLIK